MGSLARSSSKFNSFRSLTTRGVYGIEAGQAIYLVSRHPFRLDNFYPLGHPEIEFAAN